MIDMIKIFTDRRIFLSTVSKLCDKCGETIQIQLVEWCRVPIKWKCRICKHKWETDEFGNKL